MRKEIIAVMVGLILMIASAFGGWTPSNPAAASSGPFQPDGPEVDPALLAQFSRSDSVGYFVYFDDQADLSAAYGMSWDKRGRFVYERLAETAQASQKGVKNYLDTQGVDFEAFWIANLIVVKASSRAAFDSLRGFPEIRALTALPTIQLIEPVAKENGTDLPVSRSVEPNLAHIGADTVWGLGYLGTDLVVGSIDTGVRYTHEALVSQYRGNEGGGVFDHAYVWWDAVNGQTAAYDDNQHGTHTVGIMVGEDGSGNRVGVAPKAQWIACKAFNSSGTANAAELLACGEFMLAPTDLDGNHANPDLRPHIVNNSWGDCDQTYDDWFEGTIDAWLAAGLYPLFANGNAGGCDYALPPGQNTVGNPARSYHVTGVGSTGNSDGAYASHSTWGPTDSLDTLNPMGHADLKPQVVAPGVSIRSAVIASDTAYAQFSGTSMSAPHAAGLVALMWDAAPCLVGEYAATETILQQSATPIYYDDNGDGLGTYPNYATGWGEINAEEAVLQAMSECGDAVLKGWVTDAGTGDPLEGAQVAARAQGDPGNDRITKTGPDGSYHLAVFSGETYDITAAFYGYGPQTVTRSVATPGETILTDFHLAALPAAAVSGIVYDASGHGYPLYSAIQFTTPTHSETIYTHPLTGSYSIALFQDTAYQITVVSEVPGYQDLDLEGVTFTALSNSQDFPLLINPNCSAPGYKAISGLSETFLQEVQPADWAVVDHAGSGAVWRFDNPGGRVNLTGGSDNFAIIDSDEAGLIQINTSLISAVVDLSGESAVTLSFDQDFRYWSGNKDEVSRVYVSNDGGETWVKVLEQTADVRGPDHQEINISGIAANQPDVRVRFHFFNANYEWWWQVDNVVIAPYTCGLVPGGVLAGYVRDARDGTPLNQARIASTTASAQSHEILPDAQQPGGFYWLFQPMAKNLQSFDFNISHASYAPYSESITLARDRVTTRDFFLDSFWYYLPLFK